MSTRRNLISANIGGGGGNKQYIDLGLPSGTKWATCNIGAETPTDVGLYFQWGDTVGYSIEQLSSGKEFSNIDYKFYSVEDEIYTKYNSEDGKTILDLEDDAVFIYTNGIFRMPTIAEIEELVNNTFILYDTLNGVEGIRYAYGSIFNNLFIPSSGMFYEDEHFSVFDVFFWSNQLSQVGTAYCLSDSMSVSEDYREHGMPLRGVLIE